MKSRTIPLIPLLILSFIFIVGVYTLIRQPNASLEDASGWDISVRFDSAHQHPFYPFSRSAGLIGKTYYAQLNAEDDLYEEYAGAECCAGPGWNNFPAIYEKEQARRPKGWYVERKRLGPKAYKILIRGVAWADCMYENLPYVKGTLVINPARGWRITRIPRKTVTHSERKQETYFVAHANAVKFASGSGCGRDCCICADSAWLDIELIVEKP